MPAEEPSDQATEQVAAPVVAPVAARPQSGFAVRAESDLADPDEIAALVKPVTEEPAPPPAQATKPRPSSLAEDQPIQDGPWTDSELQVWRELRLQSQEPETPTASSSATDEAALVDVPEAPTSARTPKPAPASGSKPGDDPVAAPPADMLLARRSSGAEALEREVPLPAGVDFVLSGVGEVVPPEEGELAAPAEPATPTQESPSFVAEAQRRAFWSSRPVRIGLWLALLLLLAALALQWVLGQRDWLAAREPALAPALQGLCQVAGCEIAPYRQLETIVIDSSAFNRLGADAFRFSVTLRNTADMPVATPALELTLTDAQEQPLVRRVVSATELGAPPALAARGEFSGTSALTVTSVSNPSAIVGYRLMAFYP